MNFSGHFFSNFWILIWYYKQIFLAYKSICFPCLKFLLKKAFFIDFSLINY